MRLGAFFGWKMQNAGVQINILGKLLIVILSVAKNLSFREVRTSTTTMSTY